MAALIPVTALAVPAEELSGLFLRGCLPYAGNSAALREWAGREKLPEVPEPARAAFLAGAPGKVFDASNASGKLALLSSDDGICAVVTDHAGDRETAQALEHTLNEAGAKFRLVIERDDKLNPKLHNREYLAARQGRAWRILAATVRGHRAGPGDVDRGAGMKRLYIIPTVQIRDSSGYANPSKPDSMT